MPDTPPTRKTPHSSFRAVNRAAGTRAATVATQRLMRRLVIAAAIIVAFAFGLARALEERLVLRPPPGTTAGASGAERVVYPSTNGQLLSGFAIGGVDAPADGVGGTAAGSPADTVGRAARAIVVFHDHAETAAAWIPWAQEVSKRTGMSVFLAEYRGYGGVSGVPSFSHIEADALAALHAATARYGVDAGQIVVYARGLGSAGAMSVAAQRRVHAVLLESPMTSVRAFARRAVRPPMSWLLSLASGNALTPIDRAGAVSAPIWVVGGGRSGATRAAQAFLDAAREKGEMLTVEGAAAGDQLAVRGGDEYWAWFGRAVSR